MASGSTAMLREGCTNHALIEFTCSCQTSAELRGVVCDASFTIGAAVGTRERHRLRTPINHVRRLAGALRQQRLLPFPETNIARLTGANGKTDDDLRPNLLLRGGNP